MRVFALALLGALLSSAVFATTVVPPQFSEMVSGSDYVVRARVVAVEPQLTPRAGQPPLIVTNVTLEVIETVAGEVPARPVLRVLGGRVGDHEMTVEGVPEFKVGQEEVFFVRGNGRVFYPLYAAMHGRYPIRKDREGREYITRTNGVQLDDVAEIAAPLTEGAAAELQQRFKSKSAALTPAAFIEQIRTERAKGGRTLEK